MPVLFFGKFVRILGNSQWQYIFAWDDTGEVFAINIGDFTVRVNRVFNITDVAQMDKSFIAVLTNGSMFAEGENKNGQLGLGRNVSVADGSVMVPISFKAVAVDAGNDFTMALDENGNLHGTGRNLYVFKAC